MAGKTAAVVGRSNIVGLPVALLLQNEDATVTMVHSRTPNAGRKERSVGTAGSPACTARHACPRGALHRLHSMQAVIEA